MIRHKEACMDDLLYNIGNFCMLIGTMGVIIAILGYYLEIFTGKKIPHYLGLVSTIITAVGGILTWF